MTDTMGRRRHAGQTSTDDGDARTAQVVQWGRRRGREQLVEHPLTELVQEEEGSREKRLERLMNRHDARKSLESSGTISTIQAERSEGK